VQVFAPAAPARVGVDDEGSRVYCFAGDTFFGRGVAAGLATAEHGARVRADMQEVLNGCRLILNLEGVVVAQEHRRPDAKRLVMPARLTLEWLRALNVVAVSSANNHAMDLGRVAFDAMSRRLRRAGFVVLRHGSVVDLGALRVVALTDIDNSRGMGSGVVTPRDVAAIARTRARTPMVAFMHWGSERRVLHDDRVPALARALSRAGVGLVVGAHSHRASRRLEQLDGGRTLTVESLGNLLFDQRSPAGSGSVLEVRVFEQGTFFARLVRIPNYFDRLRRPRASGADADPTDASRALHGVP